MVTITSRKAQKYVTGTSGGMVEIDRIEAVGLSTDDKPTDNVSNGSLFIEIDTGGVYFYDEENETWVAFGGGGS